jgi:hypothetical protein
MADGGAEGVGHRRHLGRVQEAQNPTARSLPDLTGPRVPGQDPT